MPSEQLNKNVSETVGNTINEEPAKETLTQIETEKEPITELLWRKRGSATAE